MFRREYLRNRTGFFFALIFPIILIGIFGAIFSSGSSGPITVYAQNQDSGPISKSFLQAMNSTNVAKIVLIPSNTNLQTYLQAHSGAIGLLIPQNFSSDFTVGKQVNVTMYSNPSDTSGQIVIQVAEAVINNFNLQRVHGSVVVGMQVQNTISKSYSYIDFLVPGLIGFSILTSPMFSMVNISSEYKKSKFFKQLSLTPLTKGEWLISKVIWYVILSIISFVLMVLMGVYTFGAHVTISLWILPFLVTGPLFFVALGMLVGSVTKSVESAGVVGNIITFPMMFLSGTFFPISSMPQYLQTFAHVLPLYYLIAGLNNVMLYANYSAALFDVGVLIVLSTVIFALAVRFFKWRED
ncbi:MAG: ABC transporter permease [Nitrososphaerota archaeon]|nr:ABC transporter permease [Nitrososphaerota archaeon]MDG6924054.1 ABC transporter permease [Nitrososphaerota archaeon]